MKKKLLIFMSRFSILWYHSMVYYTTNRYKSPRGFLVGGLLYRLDKCFSFFFIDRTVDPVKT